MSLARRAVVERGRPRAAHEPEPARERLEPAARAREQRGNSLIRRERSAAGRGGENERRRSSIGLTSRLRGDTSSDQKTTVVSPEVRNWFSNGIIECERLSIRTNNPN